MYKKRPKKQPRGNGGLPTPFDESLEPQRRMQLCIELSELMMRIATHVICHTLVDFQELLRQERMSIAHAMLQRVMTTHLCNHKLTAEGLVYEYKGQPFLLHEVYKTMTLTRSVYEHLAMFYFVYEHPRTDVERDVVWKYWQLNSKKNLLDDVESGNTLTPEELQQAQQEQDWLREEIRSAPLSDVCRRKLNEWTSPESRPSIGSIEFFTKGGTQDVRRVTYSQAWKYLFNNREMASFYRHLSMHCHPVCQGLELYQEQDVADQGYEGIPLYFSCRFLAHLCRLFLKQIPGGDAIICGEFSKREQEVYQALSRLSGAW